MARSLGALTVDLILRLGGFTQGMDAAARKADASAKRIQTSLSGISGAFGRINSLLLTFGVGFSAVALVNHFRQAASAAIDFGEALVKAQAQTGESISNLQELEFAARQTDVGFEALIGGISKLQRSIGTAILKPTEDAADAFRELGINLQEFRGLDAAQQLEIVSDALLQFSEEEDRAILAQALFGRGAVEILPLLSQGAAGIRKLREESEQYGKITEEQAKSLADVDAALDKLSSSYDKVTRSATAFIALPLAGIFDRITDALISQEPPLQRLINLWVDFFKLFSSGPAGVVREFIKSLNQTRPQFSSLAGTLGLPTQTAGPVVGDRTLSAEVKVKGLTDAQREIKSAEETLKSFIDRLKEQQATLGEGEFASLRYSISQGDISESLAKLGDQAGVTEEQLLGMVDAIEAQADAIERQASVEAIQKQIQAFRDQAATVGLADAEVFEYSLTQGELARQLSETGEKQAELTQQLREAASAARAAAQASPVAQFESLSRDVDRIFAQQDRAEQALQTKIQSGLITEITAKKEVVTLHQATARELEELIPKYQALAEAIRDPAEREIALERVAQLKAEIESLSATVNNFGKVLADAFEGNFADAITDAVTGVSSLEDAFKSFLNNITREIVRFSAEQIAGTLTDALRGVFSGGGSGTSSFASFLGSLFKFSSGGYTGHGDKDEPAGIVHKGEYVIPKMVVQQPGALPFLREFHERGMRALPGYSAGGLVGHDTGVYRDSVSISNVSRELYNLLHEIRHQSVLREIYDKIENNRSEYHESVRRESILRPDIPLGKADGKDPVIPGALRKEGLAQAEVVRAGEMGPYPIAGIRPPGALERITERFLKIVKFGLIDPVIVDRSTEPSPASVGVSRPTLADTAAIDFERHTSLVERYVDKATQIKAGYWSILDSPQIVYAKDGPVQVVPLRGSQSLQNSISRYWMGDDIDHFEIPYTAPYAGMFATGGTIPMGNWGVAGEAGIEAAFSGIGKSGGAFGETNVVQNISVQAPGGSISRQTELQITAAAARGVKLADRRNN